MTSRTAVFLAAQVASVALLGAQASAVPDDLPIRQSDPTGDVTVFDGGGTKPTTGQRRTIDLTEFFVARRGNGVRLTFTIARIAAGRTFDQIVEAQFRQRGADGFLLDVLANPQHENGTAAYGSTFCVTEVRASRRTGAVRVDVPDSCVPRGSGVLRVSTYLQKKNGSGPGYSEDTLPVPGQVALR